MFYVIIRYELSTSRIDGIDFSLFKKFDNFDDALKYALDVCNDLSDYPMCVSFEILKTFDFQVFRC